MNNSLSKISSARSRKKFNVKRVIWRWHRRIGLAVAVVVINLCFTGVLLNHTDAFRLQDIPVRNSLVLNLYGIHPPKVISLSTSLGWLAQLDDKILYLEEHPLGACKGSLIGALPLQQFDGLLVACSSELLIIGSDFDVQERLGSIYQLPTPIEQIGKCGEKVCFISNEEAYIANIDKLEWPAVDRKLFNETSTLGLAPAPLQEIWLADYQGSAISWERVFLDIHSGRILGSVGVLIVDLSAIFLLILVISGVWLWSKNSSSKK